MPKTSTVSRTLVIPDLHAPYHDPKVWETILAVGKHIKAETCVIIGDFADCFSVSSFSKSPLRRQDLKSEIDVVRRELARLIRIGFDEVIYCEGNHEYRIERYLCEKAPELFGLVSARDLLTAGHKVKWVKYRDHIRRGKVLYAHDIGFAGVYAGRHTLEAAGTNIVFGHTHRAGTVFNGTHLGERRFSLNVGWAGNFADVDYMHRVKMKDWQHGLGIVTTDNRTGMCWPTFVPILNSTAVVDGVVVRV